MNVKFRFGSLTWRGSLKAALGHVERALQGLTKRSQRSYLMSTKNTAISLPLLSITAASAAIILSIASLWIMVHAGIIGLHSEDDLHYLYYLSVRSADVAHHDEIGQLVSRFLHEQAHDPHYAYRFDARQRMTDNYLMMSQLMQGVRSFILDRLAPGSIVYPEVLTRIISLSLHATLTLTLLTFGASLFFVRRDWATGIAFGMVIILASDWLFPWQPPHWILHVRPHNIREVAERAIQTIFLAFTVSGMQSSFPRGNFLILVLPIFLLRWSSRYSFSYVLVAMAGFVHSAFGGLLFMCLLASDLLLRREILHHRVVLIATVVTVGLFSSRGLIAKIFGIQASLSVSALALVIGLLAATAIKYLSTVKLPAILDMVPDRIRSAGPILSDLIVSYAMWMVLVPISVFMYFSLGGGGAPSNVWTWGDLPGRYLEMMRGPLLVGGAISLVELVRCRHRIALAAVAIASLLVSGGLLVHALSIPGALALASPDLSRKILAREQTAIRAEQGERFEYVEADIYFSAARAIDLGRPFPLQLLGYSVGACSRRQSACE